VTAQATKPALDVAIAEEPGLEFADRHQQIADLAYQLWLERGCPIGSDQEDWFRAELILEGRDPEVRDDLIGASENK